MEDILISNMLLSDLPESEIQRTCSLPTIPQTSPREAANDQQPPPSLRSTVSSPLPVLVLTGEASTGYCRLCAALKCNDMLLNVQSDGVTKKFILNMIERLNINVDFSQKHLSATVCYACVETLFMAYEFVVGAGLAQVELNNISMPKHKIKCEMVESGSLDNDLNLSNLFVQQVPLNIGPTSSTFKQESLCQPPLFQSTSSTHVLPDTPLVRGLKSDLSKKRQIIEGQKKKIKILKQKLKKLQSRNISLKNKVKIPLIEKNVIDENLFKYGMAMSSLVTD